MSLVFLRVLHRNDLHIERRPHTAAAAAAVLLAGERIYHITFTEAKHNTVHNTTSSTNISVLFQSSTLTQWMLTLDHEHLCHLFDIQFTPTGPARLLMILFGLLPEDAKDHSSYKMFYLLALTQDMRVLTEL